MSDDRTTMPERMQKTQVQLDRIRGCLIGGAAGDALGYPVEFFSEHTLWARCGDDGIQEYELDPVRGKALISDDTQMTLFTANGILCGETRMATRRQRRALSRRRDGRWAGAGGVRVVQPGDARARPGLSHPARLPRHAHPAGGHVPAHGACGGSSIDDENRSPKGLKCTEIKGFRGLPAKTGGGPGSLSDFFTIYPTHRKCRNARLRVR